MSVKSPYRIPPVPPPASYEPIWNEKENRIEHLLNTGRILDAAIQSQELVEVQSFRFEVVQDFAYRNLKLGLNIVHKPKSPGIYPKDKQILNILSVPYSQGKIESEVAFAIEQILNRLLADYKIVHKTELKDGRD